MPVPRSDACRERENASWACLAAVYAPDGANATAPATEVTLTMCDRSAPGVGVEARQESPGHPHAAEKVDACDLLDQIQVDLGQRLTRGDAGVVDECVELGMSFEHARPERLDGHAVTDVARFDFGSDVGRER